MSDSGCRLSKRLLQNASHQQRLHGSVPALSVGADGSADAPAESQDPAEEERKLDTLSSIVRGMANGSVRRHLEAQVAEVAVRTFCKDASPHTRSLPYLWTTLQSINCSLDRRD